MVKNYLKVAIRNILKNKVHSFINIFGLAVGLAACLLIYLYVRNDLSFDKFNKNYNRIIRVVDEFKQNGKMVTWAPTPSGYANTFQENFPGVKSVRLSIPQMGDAVVKYGEKLFSVKDFTFADSSFFDVFSFPLIIGNSKNALSAPFSVVLTQSESKKIFGSENPVGKTIRVNNRFDYTITGVVKDPPANSSIQFGYMASFVSIKYIYGKLFPKRQDVLNNFNSSNYYTFLMLPKGMNIEAINKNVPSFLTKIFGEYNAGSWRLLLQPLSDIHFNRTYIFDFTNKGDVQYDYILSAIALFILFIACINFINISTARSAARAKEIGIRKVLGSNRSKLIWQVIVEFAAMALVSLIIALVMVEMFIPGFNILANTHLSSNLIINPIVFLSFTVIWSFVVLLACSYPSFHITSFQPAEVIKGSVISGKKGSFVRRSLIVFQFAVSVFLIAATMVMWSQYNFLKQHKLGFNAKHVIFLPSNNEIRKSYNAFKSRLLQQHGIAAVSRANWVPGIAQDIEGYSWSNAAGKHSDSFYTLIVGPDYVKVLGLKIAAGRNFSRQMSSDWTGSFILNETAAKMISRLPGKAIGQKLKTNYHPDGNIIGIVKDFNFKSLQQKVEPVVMLMDTSAKYYSTIAIKISPSNIGSTFNYLKSVWKQFSPDLPYEYHFLDQSFEQLYRSEERISKIFGTFALLAILIACLGLFSLVSYVVQQRTKEVGIRKVLGASVPQVVNLIVKDFIKLVLIGSVIAWVPVYYFMNNWLSSFAYRINISLMTFIYSGLIALVVAMVTVSIHSIKAATANPVKSIRYE